MSFIRHPSNMTLYGDQEDQMNQSKNIASDLQGKFFKQNR